MKLTELDQIDVGNGWLYGPPFLTRYLLYRLFDNHCSILIYHSRQEGGISSVMTENNLAITSNVASSEGPPSSIYVNSDTDSAFTPLEDLLRVRAVRFHLSPESATVAQIGNVAIQVEWFSLSITSKLLIAGELPALREFEIANSGYFVVGQMVVSSWPGTTMANKNRSCWKVSVRNTKNNADYDLRSTCDWSLTALHKDQGPEPAFAVSLQKRNTTGAEVRKSQ